MSITTLILGESGTGKSTSLRNFDASQIALIQSIKKPLPFRNNIKQYVTDDWSKVIRAMQQAATNGKKIIVIDDFQYVMANEFMRRSAERGFDKFTEIASHAWEVLNAANALPDDVRVYILSHTEETQTGTVKIKTIGKMLDEKITIEGMFTIVLRTCVSDGQYFFRTKNSGQDTVKSPLGLFCSDKIDNDLAYVDSQICEYYNLAGEAK